MPLQGHVSKSKESSILDDRRHSRASFDRFPRPDRSRCRRRLLAAVCSALIWLPASAQATPGIEADTSVATAGYYELRWSAATTDVEVAEFDGPDATTPKIIYRGPDRGTVISGKTDGTRLYRVREISGGKHSGWSEPVTVTVAHHPLARALGFFGVGAFVFVSTLALIVTGARKSS